MPSKSVEKFLNNPLSSLGLKGVIVTRFLSVFIHFKYEDIAQYSVTDTKLWCKKCKSCEENTKKGCINCLNGYIDLNKKEISQLKNELLQTSIKEWLDIDRKDCNYNHKTDCIGKMFLEKDFGYLCWWRIGTTSRAPIFKKAAKDMGKDFVLSMPIRSLPVTSNDNCWWRIRREGAYCINDIKDFTEMKYGPSFEKSLRALQEAGFTKKDGAIFSLDLNIEAEADELRAKYQKLKYREAKIILEIAKEEGWVK